VSRSSSQESRHLIYGGVGLLLAMVVVLQLGFAESALLYLAPALLILIPLAFDRYPGERLLQAVIAPPVTEAGRSEPPARRLAPLHLLPRGGALLAFALAGRGPPQTAAAASPRLASMASTERKEKPMRRFAFAVALAGMLVLPSLAQAHVSLHPNEVPTGSFATLQIRVPNESENANTVKLAVQFPPGFLDVSPEYMPGWSAKVVTTKLAKPVKTADGEVTEGVKEVIWTGHGEQGEIPPGQFLAFPISTEIPGKAGEVLAFKVLQYYDDGEVVRWIGGPESEQPAPQIDVTAAGGVLQDVAGSETAPPAPGASGEGEAEASSGSSGGNGSEGLAIAALIVGALGLLAGGAALVRSRRSSGGSAAA
jgi:periplasmic copper chaperone A